MSPGRQHTFHNYQRVGFDLNIEEKTNTRALMPPLSALWQHLFGLLVLLFTCVYIGVFVFSERQVEISTELNLWFILYILGLVILSWLVRYLRWWLLLSSLHGKVNFMKGFFCYLSGFAYTASPGKAGELSRIVLYKKMLVKPENIVTCFFSERAIDLIVVILLSLFVFLTFTDYLVVPVIALFLIVLLLCLIYSKRFWEQAHRFVDKTGSQRLQLYFAFMHRVRASIIEINQSGLLIISFFLGVLAWSLVAFSLMAVCEFFSVEMNQWFLFGVYPLAMLVGAISFIPGGIGTTEAAITAMLVSQGVAGELAFSIALLVRIFTLWSAVWVGMGCMWTGIAFMKSDKSDEGNGEYGSV